MSKGSFSLLKVQQTKYKNKQKKEKKETQNKYIKRREKMYTSA